MAWATQHTESRQLSPGGSPPLVLAWQPLGALVLLIGLLWGPSAPSTAQTATDPGVDPGSFVLTLQDELLSLHATTASLRAIFAEIGRRLAIDVRLDIPAHDRVTLAFERLPLPEALQRLEPYVNYAYITRQAGRIRAIRVYARSATTLPATATAAGTPPPPSPPEQQGGSGRRTPLQNALQLDIDPRQFLPPSPP